MADVESVLSYLRRRGFSEAEEALRKEARTKSIEGLRSELDIDGELPIPRAVLLDGDGDGSVSLRVYDESYMALRRWVDGSIDAYKGDLESLLFPLFVYMFLSLMANPGTTDTARKFFESHRGDHAAVHEHELKVLAAVHDVQHVRENDLCQRFLSTRYMLKMSRMAYTLFVQFLTDQNLFQLTRLTQQHLSIRVIADVDSSLGPSSVGNGLIGETALQFGTTNQKAVLLGELPPERTVHEEMKRRVQAALDAGEMTVQVLDRVKQIDPQRLLQSEAAGGGATEAALRSPSRDRIPLPASKFSDISTKIAALVEASKAVNTGPQSLPSVCCYTFHNTYGNLNSLTTSSDTHVIAGGFQDSTIRVWNLGTEQQRGSNPKRAAAPGSIQLVGHGGPVYGLALSQDAKYLVSSSADRTARLWSLETQTNIVCYKGHNYPVWDVDFGPEGLYFATASHDRTARLWSCDQIYPLRIFVGHLSDVDTVRFHPNSNYVLTGSSDKTCRLWDVQKGECVRIMKEHSGPVSSVAISPDGRTMASGGDDASIVLWDLGSAQPIKRMRGHTDAINCLAFSKDGNLLMSGGADRTVRFWSAKDSETKEAAAYSSLGLNGRTAFANELGAYATKKTPILHVAFSRRNLALAFGAFTG